jgi:membrane-associated phospholipid phosphatase
MCLGCAIVLIYPVLFIEKGGLELLINQHHYSFLDIYFKYVTHMGDGLTLAILLIFLLFSNYTLAIVSSFSIVFQAIFVSIFKRWIFKGLERPLAFFDDSVTLNFVDGVDVHSSNTFPSGHTATGFALFALILLILKNRGTIISSVLFVLAFSVGFSRVYLLQHFFIDVYFGALIGVLSVVLGIYLAESIFTKDQLESWSTRSLRDVTLTNKAT